MNKKVIVEYQEFDDWSILSNEEHNLILKANEAAVNAYAQYSNFYVGAAVQINNGKVFIGNNQENASYPCGICAERVALFSAQANYPNTIITSIAITAFSKDFNISKPVGPCGLCRQVILEFEEKQNFDIKIFLFDTKKIIKIAKAKDLLPLYFQENKLKINQK
tara:strand:+ start:5531 stop:6022 length:492 start_codon:yes stop_codon:yes gene_type:complete